MAATLERTPTTPAVDTRPTADRTAIVAVASCYVLTRLLLVIGETPTATPDTPDYRGPISLLGEARRPWLLPTIYRALPDNGVMLFQTLVSAAAFVVLAVVIAGTLRTAPARVVVMGAILLLGVSPQVVWWDAALLSESLAMSLTLLLIAALIAFDLSRSTHAVALVALFVAWVFVRDAHAWLGLLVVAGVGMWQWRQRRSVAVAFALLAVVVWGVGASQNDDRIENTNITTHVAYRIAGHDDRVDYFLDAGMPAVDGLELPTAGERFTALKHDEAFQAWVAEGGVGTYVRFVATHPAYAARAFRAILFDDNPDTYDVAMVEASLYPKVVTDSVTTIWPLRSQESTMLLLAAAGAAVWAERESWRRFLGPLLLVGSTLPHAFLVYHGSGMELNRHSLVLALVLTVGLVWALAVWFDRWVECQAMVPASKSSNCTSSPLPSSFSNDRQPT